MWICRNCRSETTVLLRYTGEAVLNRKVNSHGSILEQQIVDLEDVQMISRPICYECGEEAEKVREIPPDFSMPQAEYEKKKRQEHKAITEEIQEMLERHPEWRVSDSWLYKALKDKIDKDDILWNDTG